MDGTATPKTLVPLDPILTAETRETSVMSRSRYRSIRVSRWAGAAALSIALLGIPLSASARPYEPSDVPMPDGDPTADDQPSPAPKPKRSFGVPGTRGGPEMNGFRGLERGRIFWLAMARTWVRISIR